MSLSVDDIRGLAEPALAKLVDDIREDFLAEAKGYVAEVNTPKLAGLFKSAADYRLKALTAATPDEARLNLDLARTAIRRIKTIALAERIVAEERTAEFLARTASAILETMAKVAKGVLQAVAAGAVSGLTGGAGPAVGGAVGAVASVLRGQ